MKCFSHPQADAVAQCSQCQKRICTTCAHDVGGAPVCSSCCEAGIREEIARAQRSTVGVWVFTGIVTGIAVIAIDTLYIYSTGICGLLVSLLGLVSSVERV
jgi:hypothetical protein